MYKAKLVRSANTYTISLPATRELAQLVGKYVVPRVKNGNIIFYIWDEDVSTRMRVRTKKNRIYITVPKSLVKKLGLRPGSTFPIRLELGKPSKLIVLLSAE